MRQIPCRVVVGSLCFSGRRQGACGYRDRVKRAVCSRARAIGDNVVIDAAFQEAAPKTKLADGSRYLTWSPSRVRVSAM